MTIQRSPGNPPHAGTARPPAPDSPPGAGGARPSISETVDGKARRLLARGCVFVVSCNHEHVAAHVLGDSGIYDVEYGPEGWHCTCANRGRNCSHVYAVRLVTTTTPGALK